ncbi:hypothetical protein JCM4814A_91950 [Streptomyces phaeofaciens JCM 4814]|uniref:Lipoprotein n=2 Tax=Streptomyces phaeofaciens TaxID=68254 RepID=A0A918LYF4_9ACTN|nr:hypothetical protein GCM10010226_55300 [Streptomyces phaeofaciens]
MNRRALAIGAAVVVALTVPAASAVADPEQSMPAAQAFNGDTPLTSIKDVSDYCAAHAGDCRFKIDRAASSEYHTAVKSLGNAVVNCTKADIKVTRQVSLQVSSSDNLGGEITGRITLEGQLNASGSVTAGVSGEAGGNFKTPDQSKGPSAEVNAKGSANGSGTIGGSATLRAAFEGAFKLSYSKTWSTQQTESTSYELVVKPGDALVFGASAAMQRVAGSISTGGGLGVRNVFVDGPSSVNTSTFVADTFTVPGNTCQKLRPGGKTGVEDTTPKPPTRSAALPSAPELPEGSRLKERVELGGELS